MSKKRSHLTQKLVTKINLDLLKMTIHHPLHNNNRLKVLKKKAHIMGITCSKNVNKPIRINSTVYFLRLALKELTYFPAKFKKTPKSTKKYQKVKHHNNK